MEHEPASPRPRGGDETIREGVIEALRTVFDPEIPVNIYELGLVYEVEVRAGRLGLPAHDADLADVPGGGDAAPRGRGEGARACRASRTSSSTWSGIRPGARA